MRMLISPPFYAPIRLEELSTFDLARDLQPRLILRQIARRSGCGGDVILVRVLVSGSLELRPWGG